MRSARRARTSTCAVRDARWLAGWVSRGEIRAASTGEVGTQFVDADGDPIATFPASESESGGATAELEILRGQLSRIIVDRTRDDTEYIFGDEIVTLDDRDDGVTVTFAHGSSRTFDLVVVAEGLRSRTRSLVFAGSDAVRELGLYTAYLTIPRTDTDTDWWRWYNPGRGRGITLRPDNVGTTRATLSFQSDIRGLADLDRDAVITILRRTFADAGWQSPRGARCTRRRPALFRCPRPSAPGVLGESAGSPGRRCRLLLVACQRHEHQPRHHRRLRSRRGARGHR